MHSLVELGLLLLLVLVAGILLRSAYVFFRKRKDMTRWQRVCCIVALLAGSLAWLSASAIVLLIYWDLISETGLSGRLIRSLSYFSVGATAIAFVFGVASRIRAGYFVAMAAAGQGVFWLVLLIFVVVGD